MATHSYTVGAQWLFADHATDFGAAPATAANSLIIGTPTDVQFDVSSIASGGARQSAKADLGANRARQFALDVCLEFAVAPADNAIVSWYWAPSPISTAGTGNPGGITGSDAAYSETAGLLGQLIKIGDMTLRNNVLNIAHVGVFEPPHRYGVLVMVSAAGQTIVATVDECHTVLTEIIDDAT